MAEDKIIHMAIEGAEELVEAQARLDAYANVITIDGKKDKSKPIKEALEQAMLDVRDAQREYKFSERLEVAEYFDEYFEPMSDETEYTARGIEREPTPEAEKERRKKLDDRAYKRGERNLADAMEDRSELGYEDTREYKVSERRRRQRENRRNRRIRNANLTKFGNLFVDKRADLTSTVNGLASLYTKAAASGGGAAFLSNLANDLFEDNTKAANKFFNLLKQNPAGAFQMAGKGMMAIALDGLPMTAALAVMYPIPANRDEQALLDSMDARGSDFITAYTENNMNKEFVQRIVYFEDAPPPMEKDGQLQTHLMSAEFLGNDNTIPAVFPRIVNEDGVLKELSLEEAKQFAIDNGEFIQFPNIDDAIRFSQEYKGANNSPFNKFYTTEGLFEKHFGKRVDGMPEGYVKQYMAAIHNEFDGAYRSSNTYTNDTVSPEAQMTIKAKLDEYYMAEPNDREFFGMAEPNDREFFGMAEPNDKEFFGMAEPIDSESKQFAIDTRNLVAPPSDLGSVNLGYVMDAPDYSDLHSMQAIRTENGYKITDALNMEQTPENTRLINDLNMQNPNIPEGSFARNFVDDSYVIDIDIPNFIQAEPFALDTEPFNNEGRPVFDTSAVSIDRQRHMQKMLDALKTYRYVAPHMEK